MITVVLSLLVFLLLARLILRPGGPGRLTSGEAPYADAELARLREEVERLSAQVERLTDEQGFVMRLLDERSAPPRLPPAPQDERAETRDPHA